jgi:CubicO group peptidase (beta-lactamase class C family)
MTQSKSRKALLITAITLSALILIFSALPNFSRKALIHWTASTDDFLIFDNNRIESANPSPWPLSKAYNHGIPEGADLDTLLQYKPLAFLILKEDSLVFERYFNGHTQTSISNTFSTTKTIVSLLVGCAIKDGSIESIDDLVINYLPDVFEKGIDKNTTIGHLLRMSSGFDYDEAYASPFSPTARSYYGRDLDRQMKELKQSKLPGQQFDYIGANTQVLGMILVRTTGQSLSSYAADKLWKPLGAEHDALWSKDREDGIEKAYCCFTATARDLARLGKLIADSGRWNGQQIIPIDYFLEMIRPSLEISDQGNPVDFYGLHIWLTKWRGEDVYYARGIRGQFIITIPARKLVIVRLGEKRSDQYNGWHTNDLFFYLRLSEKLISDAT